MKTIESKEVRHVLLPNGDYNQQYRIKCRSLRLRLLKLQNMFPERNWAIGSDKLTHGELFHIVEIIEVTN